MKLLRINFLVPLVSWTTLVLALALLICGYAEAWHVPWFEQRYLPTIALAHGQPIYRDPPDGPVILCLYGPLSYLAFLPAAFLPTVQSVFAGGSLLATAFLVIPFVVVGYSFIRKHQLAPRDWAPLLLLPLAAIASLRPLSYIATLVTADAPSTCLMALSAWVLYGDYREGRARRWKTAAYSSLALVLSIGCKQNMVFAAAVIVSAVFYFFGRKFGWLYVAWTAVCGALALGLVVAVHRDIHGIFFNNVLVGLRIAIIKANLFPGAYRVFENIAVLGLTFTGMWLIGFLTKGSAPWPRQSRFLVVFFAVAVVLSLVGIRFYAAAGGDVNDLSHGVYFLVLGIVITGFELVLLTKSNPNATLALRIFLAVGALTLIGSGLPTRYNAAWMAKMRHRSGSVEAYEYARRNPGQVYFAFNPIGQYLAEHRFYTTEWGVMNLLMAKQQFTRQDILKFIPEKAQYVALPRDYIADDPGFVISYVAPHRVPANCPGLESFEVYRIER
jgi:hypothetical protein